MADKKINIILDTKGEEKARRALGGVENSIGSMVKGAIAGAASFYTLKKALDIVVDLGNLNSEFKNLKSANDSLAKSVGLNADLMLGRMREGVKGTVNELDLLQQANNALLLGLPVTEKDMGLLAEAGRRLGKAMGVDAKMGLESLVVGIGRQSKLWLDNLGIIIDTEAAYDTFAQKIGKATNELTDQEKKLAFYQAAVQSTKDKLSSLGKDQETFKDFTDKTSVALKDMAITLSDGISPALEQASKDLNVFAGTLLTIINSPLGEFLFKTMNYGFEVGTAKITGAANALELFNTFVDEAGKNRLKKLNTYLGYTTVGFDNFNSILKESDVILDPIGRALEQAAKQVVDVTKKLEEIPKTDETEIKILEETANLREEIIQRNLDALILAKETEMQVLIDNYAAQQELAIADQEAKQMIADDFSESYQQISMNQYDFERKKIDEMLAYYKQAGMSKLQLDKWYQTQKQQLDIITAQNFMSGIAQSMQMARQGGAVSANVAKRAAQASALVDTYAAANKALAAYPPPFSFIAMAAAIAAGLANVAVIEKTKFASGGIVSGTGKQDSVSAMLTPGEVVLNLAQQETLLKNMNQGLTINIQGDFVGTEENADKLAAIIEKRSKNRFNRIAINA